jgi:hypothetical protein
MTRLESVAWTLAGGGATWLALSAVLKGQSWAAAFAMILVAVAPLACLGTRHLRHGQESDEAHQPEALIWAAPHRLIDNGALGVVVSSGVSDGGRHCRPAVATPQERPRLFGRRSRPGR